MFAKKLFIKRKYSLYPQSKKLSVRISSMKSPCGKIEIRNLLRT